MYSQNKGRPESLPRIYPLSTHFIVNSRLKIKRKFILVNHDINANIGMYKNDHLKLNTEETINILFSEYFHIILRMIENNKSLEEMNAEFEKRSEEMYDLTQKIFDLSNDRTQEIFNIISDFIIAYFFICICFFIIIQMKLGMMLKLLMTAKKI